MLRRPPRSPLFPSTTLFRSLDAELTAVWADEADLTCSNAVVDPGLVRNGGYDRSLLIGAAGSPRCSSCPLLSTSPASSPKKDRKSTRLNSSHANISYAVFCL